MMQRWTEKKRERERHRWNMMQRWTEIRNRGQHARTHAIVCSEAHVRTHTQESLSSGSETSGTASDTDSDSPDPPSPKPKSRARGHAAQEVQPAGKPGWAEIERD